MAVPDDPFAAAIDRARGRREGLRAAMDRLEAALAAPVPGREEAWAGGLGAALDALSAALAAHVAVTEAPDGLLAQVAADAPRLRRNVDRLRTDHAELTVAVDSVCRAAAGGAAPGEVRSAALDVLGRLARHRHMGSDLVYDAYQVDIGAAD